MVGKSNILKEKQHKTKQKKKKKKKKKQENLTHLWDLKTKQSPTLGVEKQTNKQTNKNETTRRQKLDPTPMPLEIEIMMHA